MVVLISKLPIFHHKSKKSKLAQSESIAFQSFQSTLSENLHKLFSDQKNGLNYASLSLSWYIPCFKFIQEMNKAFAKLVKDLDYPVTKWKGKLGEDYFSYTLNMLDVLNSITSSISNLSNSRLSLSHAITLIASNPSSAIHHLKPIIPKKIKAFDNKEISNVESFSCGQERVIHEAMMKMRSVDMLILKVLFCGLSGERIGENGCVNSGEFDGFNLGIGEEFVIIKEIKEVNEVVKRIEGSLVSGKKSNKGVETEELKRKLNEFESLAEIVEKEVNCLFSEVLARRNELINCFRLPKSA